jgi:Ca2+-binding RTX toxin-like protein
MQGYGGNDRLAPGYANYNLDGSDQLFGGAGNDTIIVGTSSYVTGRDLADGGAGTDTISFAQSALAVNVGLAASGLEGSYFDNAGNSAQIFNVENVIGSSLADIISGSDGSNRLYGMGGNDLISGGGGNDVIFGDIVSLAGNDVLYGDSGNDLIFGGAGDDLLTGGGAGQLYGDAGFDIVLYNTSLAAVTVNLTTGVSTGRHSRRPVLRH